MGYDAWLLYYQRNPQRHARLEETLDWRRQSPLVGADRAAIARSLQRFELGESGDGVSLLAKAGRAQDPTYVAALELFVIEEQKHSELFRRALEYLQYPTLASHWSDAAFVRLRRALGLRLELTLFLVAEVEAAHSCGPPGGHWPPVPRSSWQSITARLCAYAGFAAPHSSAGRSEVSVVSSLTSSTPTGRVSAAPSQLQGPTSSPGHRGPRCPQGRAF